MHVICRRLNAKETSQLQHMMQSVQLFSKTPNYLALDKVDILSIDTEGTDPHVIFAGTETLKKTRYLEFEVHRDLEGTPWATTTLQSVIEFLDNLQFDCFWASGKGELFKITQCWNEQYEADSHCWSNVVCVKRGDPWHGILAAVRSIQITAPTIKTE